MFDTTEIDNILREELESIAKDLIQKHVELGQKSSGDWVNSVEVVVQGGRGGILANDYTKYLTKGRADGNKPPIAPLEKWVNDKLGISGKDARSVAFAVAFKIGKEGTNIYKQGGTDLIESVITNERMTKIKQRIKQAITIRINEELIQTLRNAN